MREAAPGPAALFKAEVVTWQDVARRLAPSEALVEFLLSDSASLAFVVTPDTLAVVDLGLGRRDIARLVEFARGAIESRGSLGGIRSGGARCGGCTHI